MIPVRMAYTVHTIKQYHVAGATHPCFSHLGIQVDKETIMVSHYEGPVRLMGQVSSAPCLLRKKRKPLGFKGLSPSHKVGLWQRWVTNTVFLNACDLLIKPHVYATFREAQPVAFREAHRKERTKKFCT